MNHQLLFECCAEETEISGEDAGLLDLEHCAQIESFKASSKQGCISVAANHICKKAYICDGSLWLLF